ncbi:MAG: CYTH domain-containing protein [Janthinobacterium lividum]
MAIEKELKLALGSARVGAAVAFLDTASGAVGRTITLGNVYFDTAALELAQARVALRLRRTPDGWLQTLKTAGKATQGLHARGEWEQPVAGEALALPALLAACDDATARASLAAWADDLRPVFRTDFDRTLWTIHVGDTEIEAALDLGTVASDRADTTVPIREIELELKTGDEGALLAFAARLRAAVPGLTPDDVSKAARGYGLLRDAASRASHDEAAHG